MRESGFFILYKLIENLFGVLSFQNHEQKYFKTLLLFLFRFFFIKDNIIFIKKLKSLLYSVKSSMLFILDLYFIILKDFFKYGREKVSWLSKYKLENTIFFLYTSSLCSFFYFFLFLFFFLSCLLFSLV